MLYVQVIGPTKSGKGHLMAAIAKALSDNGIVVHVQGATTHNKEKLEKPMADLASRLQGETIVIAELQSGV